MRKLSFALVAAFTASAAQSQPSSPPRLLIAISVDQFSSDLFAEYRPHFTGGLARLSTGTVFRNGYQAHAATETCPGHSTILTGTHPARNGIIGNLWHDFRLARADKRVYCAEDPRVPGSTSAKYTVSPFHLKVPTLGDILKQRQPQSLNVAVAGKDRSAVMMSGRRVDQRWFPKGQQFITDLTSVPVPVSVTRTNAAVAAALGMAREPLDPPPLCAAKARAIPVGSEGQTVGTGRFARAAGDMASFRSSPEYDAAVLALSAALIQELRLGADTSPDILSIGLSATDYVGHQYGSGGQEMCLQLLSLDRDLGDFFTLLDRSGLDYAVVLTSDHGVADLPERARLGRAADAVRVDPALDAAEVGKAIGARLGLRGPVLAGESSGDIYIDSAISGTDRARVLREALAFYRAHPQVEAALSAEELRRIAIPTTPPDRWSVAERTRASFDPDRSGDIVVLLKPNVTPIAEPTGSFVATHGSPWDYDRRVPILFWRRGMTASDRADPIATVDILPTLAAMLALPPPAEIDGKCLPAIQDIACPAR